MKLEVGKTYFNRMGEKIKIVAYNPEDHWPFTAGIVGKNISSYSIEGYYYARDSHSKKDLVQVAPDAPETP